MLNALLMSLVLCAPQDKPKTVVAEDPVKLIEAALDAGPGPAKATIEKFAEATTPAVVKAIGKGMLHDDLSVRIAAVQALRYNTSPDSFKELFRHRGNRLVVKQMEVAAEYYLALGQHADLKALHTLTRDLRSRHKSDEALEARILAIGRMRDRAAIDALVKFQRLARRKSRAKDNAALALRMLTGHDGGTKGLEWTRWWKEHRRDFRFGMSPKKQAPAADAKEKPGGKRRRGKKTRGKKSDRSLRTWKALWVTPAEIKAKVEAAAKARADAKAAKAKERAAKIEARKKKQADAEGK